MAIKYVNILQAIALRTTQVADAVTAAAFDTGFQTVLPSGGPTGLSGVDIPATEMKRMILASEKRIAEQIALSTLDIYRAPLYGKSDPMATGSQVPTIDQNGSEFLGGFTNVLDNTTGQPLTEKPKSEIFRLNRLYAAGFLKIRPWHFHFADQKLYHTRDYAYLEGCSWSFDTQSAAYDGDGTSPLPQSCENWLIADALSMAAQEGWFVTEASMYGQMAEAARQALLKGIAPSVALPDTTGSSEPVKN